MCKHLGMEKYIHEGRLGQQRLRPLSLCTEPSPTTIISSYIKGDLT